MQVLILGVGNVLLSDESIGVRVVQHLEEHVDFDDRVTIMDGGTAGMELMESISTCSHLLIVDALRSPDAQPGTIIERFDADVPVFFRNRISPHQLGISDVLAMLQLTGEGPERMALVGVVPESLETGLDLTKTIADQFDALQEKVLTALRAWGIEPVSFHKTSHVAPSFSFQGTA